MAFTSPLLDETHLDAQTFGDLDLAREVLDLFRGQAHRLAPVIAGEAGEGDKARCDAAHTLKGSARGIGAFAVAERAEACETALRAGRSPDLAALRAALAATEAAIAARLAQSG